MTAVLALLISIAAALTIVLWRAVRPATRLQIGDHGILDRSWGMGWIRWDEIEGAYPPTLDEAETVRLRVRVTERIRRLSSRRRQRSSPAGERDRILLLPLNLAGTDINALDVLQEILEHDGSKPTDS